MIEYFKNLWMRITKSNITISNKMPASEKIVVEISAKNDIPPAPKISKPRRKYVRKATTH